MERRVLLAATISSIFLMVYLQVMIKTRPPLTQALHQNGQLAAGSNVEQETSKHSGQDALKQVIAQEGIVTVESPELALQIGTKSAAIRRVTMKRFSDTTTHQTLQFGNASPVFSLRPSEEFVQWNVASSSASRVIFESLDGQGVSRHLSYQLNEDDSVDIKLDQMAGSKPVKQTQIVFYETWYKGDKLNNRNNQLEAVIYSEQGGKNSYKRAIAPVRSEKIVPRGTIFSLSERHFCLSLKPSTGHLKVVLLPNLVKSEYEVISAEASTEFPQSENPSTYEAKLYIGPRDYLYLRKAGFSESFKIGVLGQIGLMLLIVLSAIAGVTKNYGVAIILFSVGITCLMAPFTLLGFRSMKKMQELKPKMDKIMAQHKNDPKRANQEILTLYKEHKVSPLGGCLPIFIQMPIFIAMFQAISHFIALRGQPFLWIKDLSMPDQILNFSFQMPIIGNQLNLLPIIMAGAMYAQTQMTQANSGVAQDNPTAKMMSGPIMPVIFCIMFYHFPAGLVLYWLSNTVTSLAFYRLAKS